MTACDKIKTKMIVLDKRVKKPAVSAFIKTEIMVTLYTNIRPTYTISPKMLLLKAPII